MSDPRILILIIGVLALIALPAVIISFLNQRARKWPTAQGTVEQVALLNKPSRPDYWYGEVRYSYAAGQGHFTDSFVKGFTKREQAEAFLTRFPKTAELVVRYKPNKPGKSVVDDRGEILRKLV